MPSLQLLQKILDARFDWEHADIEDKPEREKIYDELWNVGFRESAAVQAHLSKHSFGAAIDRKYWKYRDERRRKEMPNVPYHERGT